MKGRDNFFSDLTNWPKEPTSKQVALSEASKSLQSGEITLEDLERMFEGFPEAPTATLSFRDKRPYIRVDTTFLSGMK